MEEWLHLVTKEIIAIINVMALIVVTTGTGEAFFTGIRMVFSAPTADGRFREALVRYERWLVAGLTFQLAADIIGTSIAPTWLEVGQLGAIAAIRTFLNFFLERDLAELRGRDAESPRPIRST